MAVRFDAAADRLSYSAAAPPATFTIAMWVYLSVDRNDYSTLARIWTTGSATVVTWETGSDGTAGPNYFSGGGNLANSTGLVAGEWRKVAITRSGSTGQMFIAAPGGSTELDSGTVGTNTPGGITLGGLDPPRADEWFNGRYACVRIWDSILSQAEIEAEWQSGTPVKTSGLWANWPLENATDLTDTVAGRVLVATAGGTLTTEDGPPLGDGSDTTGEVGGTLPALIGALRHSGEVLSGQLVAGRNLRPSSVITDSGGTYRLRQVARIPVNSLQLTFPGWYTGAAGVGDLDIPNDYTVHSCFIEHGGALVPVIFPGGATSATVTPGQDVQGIAVKNIAAGDTYYIRSYITPTSGGSYPRLYAVPASPDESSRKGQDHANALGTTNLTNLGDVCGPIVVTGSPTGGLRYGVAVVGDSIANGSNDTFGDYDRVGYLYRALNGQRPFLLFAISGEQAAQFVTQGADRARYIGQAAQYVICAYGVNDLQGGRTVAQTQAALLSIWAAAVAANPTVKVFQTTITPKSSSTDSWATVGNQTADGAVQPGRVPLNAWIRAGAPIASGVAVAVGTPGALLAGQPGHPLHGYLEVADLCESARDSGLWQAGFTDDGVHPTSAGHIAMAAGLQIALLADPGMGVIAGSLPSLGGQLAAAEPPNSGVIAGALPTPVGALAGSNRGALSGSLPALMGTLTGPLAAIAGTIAGQLPPVGGVLVAGVPPPFVTQNPGGAGAAPVMLTPNPAGSRVDLGTRLLVINGGGSPVTLTLAMHATVDGLTFPDRQITIPNGAFPANARFVDVPSYYGDGDGYAQLSWSATGSVTVCVLGQQPT